MQRKVGLIAVLVIGAACSDAVQSPGDPGATSSATASAPSQPTTPDPGAIPAPAVNPEAERGLRDPFERLLEKEVPIEAPMTISSQSPDYGVSELRLTGIVSAGSGAKGMVVDPEGTGWIVRRGNYLGKAEAVRSGSRTLARPWRVDRVGQGRVVLVQEDPLEPGVPLRTRVLRLSHS